MFTKVVSKPGRPSEFRHELLHAEATRRLDLLQAQATGAMRRLGIEPKAGRLNMFELDKLFSSKQIEPRDRIAYKSLFAQCGLID
jgi:hypothetical protein